jgi:CRP/FNR family transcriptional regulator, nitrogen fixation regulation protein
MQVQSASATGARRSQPITLVSLTDALEAPGFVMGFGRNEEIFGEEQPADFVYRVVTGAVRTGRILRDGRRQITGFFLPGDVFGLELGELHRSGAEAVCEAEVALVRRSALKLSATGDGLAAHELWTLTAEALDRTETHLMLLGCKTAAERLASFLLAMAERCSGRGRVVDLPMCRQDIADYLGLTIETVSRSFSQLERERLIELPSSRAVMIRRWEALSALATAEDLQSAA